MTFPRFPLFAVLGLFAVAASASADDRLAPFVRDEAHLFSPEALQKADEEIAGIKDTYHLDFALETVSAPPDEVMKQLQGANTNAQKAQILHAWGTQQANAAAAEGVYVLVCKDAVRGWFGRVYGCVVVTVAPETLGRAFTAADAKALHDRLVWFSRGQSTSRNDMVLGNAVAHVHQQLAYNLRPPFPWLAVGAVMTGALALWGALRVVRLRLQARTPPGGLADSRQLSLRNGMLGGMFGAVAGHWIYDTLFIAASGADKTTAAPVALTPPPHEAGSAPVEQTPEQVKAERMDLTARDHATEEEPTP